MTDKPTLYKVMQVNYYLLLIVTIISFIIMVIATVTIVGVWIIYSNMILLIGVNMLIIKKMDNLYNLGEIPDNK